MCRDLFVNYIFVTKSIENCHLVDNSMISEVILFNYLGLLLYHFPSDFCGLQKLMKRIKNPVAT